MSFSMSRHPLTRRNFFSASTIAALSQRTTIDPPCQRFTFIEYVTIPLFAYFADRERSFGTIVNTHSGDREQSGATLDGVSFACSDKDAKAHTARAARQVVSPLRHAGKTKLLGPIRDAP